MLVAVVAFAALGRAPLFPLVAFVAVAVAEVAAAVARAGRGRQIPLFLLATACVFLVDVAASFAAVGNELARRPRRWRQPRRDLAGP